MLLLIFLILPALLSFSAHASVVIMGTRVVYLSQQKSINVQLNNTGGSSPSLIQSWIDTGDSSSTPDSMKVPFIITPPVFRINPGTGQTLRIMYTQEYLPRDKETLFYLNVLDIPAKPDDTDINTSYLQLAVRSRIKLFFRPDSLKIKPSAAYKKVIWSLNNIGSKSVLKADNRTPYYITYSKISLISEIWQHISPTNRNGGSVFCR